MEAKVIYSLPCNYGLLIIVYDNEEDVPNFERLYDRVVTDVVRFHAPSAKNFWKYLHKNKPEHWNTFTIDKRKKTMKYQSYREPPKDRLLPVNEVRNIRLALLYDIKGKPQLSREYGVSEETIERISNYSLYPAIKVT